MTFLGGFFGLLALALAAIVLIDPYDTGYFPSLIGPGVACATIKRSALATDIA